MGFFLFANLVRNETINVHFVYNIEPTKTKNKMKRFSNLILLIFLFGLVFNSCDKKNNSRTETDESTTVAFDLSAAKSEIQQMNNAFTKAHVNGEKDSLTMVNYYTQDAKIFPPNADPVIGKQAISELTSIYMKYPISEFSEQTTAFYGNEEYLIDEGTYIMSYGKNNTIEKGKYLNVWKKEGGKWKVFSNIWNANKPASSIE